MVNLITEHIDIWTAAQIQKTKGGRGRGKNSNGQSPHGIKKLRELILELAVRGKLVPQDHNDEPASILLEKIAKEKARLIKEGKIKKPKKLPVIGEDEKPFELPEGWVWVRLGNVGNIFNGNSVNARVKEEKYTNIEGGLAFIATKDVGYGWEELDYGNGVTIPKDEPKFKVAQKRAVLICAEGGSAGKKCGITTQDICFGNKLFANELFCKLESSFLLANYLCPTFFGQFTEKMTGIIGGISAAKFNQLLVPIPPLSEQNRIVAKIDELMALCDQLEQQQTDSNTVHQTLVETLLTTLTNAADQNELEAAWQRIANHFDTLFTTEHSIDQFKQTILQLAVIGKLVPQDPNHEPASVLLEEIAKEKKRLIENGALKSRKTDFKDIESDVIHTTPNGWEQSRVGDLSLIVTDGTHKTPTYIDYGIRFVSAKDIRSGELSFEDCKFISKKEHEGLSKRCKPEYGNILVSKSGSIGTVTIVKEEGEFSLFESLALIKIPVSFIDKRYFCLALQNACNGLTDSHIRGMAVKHLHLNILRGLRITLPPIVEQTRIVTAVDELMAFCDKLKARLNDAQTAQVQLADAIVEQTVA